MQSAGDRELRLSADAPRYANALRQQETYCRNFGLQKLAQIADLPGNIESLDLSENNLTVLTGEFPSNSRLQTLLLANNRIREIEVGFAEGVPNLTSLSLAYNDIADVSQLDFLRPLTKLRYLTLEGNPVAGLSDIRQIVSHIQPAVRILDGQKLCNVDQFRPHSSGAQAKADAERARLLELLEQAQTIEELSKLEEQLEALIS